jgi:hypothetical protein
LGGQVKDAVDPDGEEVDVEVEVEAEDGGVVGVVVDAGIEDEEVVVLVGAVCPPVCDAGEMQPIKRNTSCDMIGIGV